LVERCCVREVLRLEVADPIPVPDRRTASRAGLVPADEQLRTGALSGQVGVVTHGLAVLVRGGVAAWAGVLLEHAPLAERPGRRLGVPAGPAADSPVRATGELIRLLAALTLTPA
jgi:hypothetical protein